MNPAADADAMIDAYLELASNTTRTLLVSAAEALGPALEQTLIALQSAIAAAEQEFGLETHGRAVAAFATDFAHKQPEVMSATLGFVVAVLCWRCSAASYKQGQQKKQPKQKKADEKPKGDAPKVKKTRVRICKFCEVEIASKKFLEAHVNGKRHKKLAEGCATDQCWVWVEKEPAPTTEAAPTAEAPRAEVEVDDGGWEVVDDAAKRKAARAAAAAAAAAKKQAAADAAAAAARDEEARQSLRVHRRCNECGVRARDGATIETDPDDQTKAYCSACWDRFYHGEAPAPEPAPIKKHVTRWS